MGDQDRTTEASGLSGRGFGSVRAMGVVRALVGVVMIVAPRSVARSRRGVPAPGDLVFMVRTIGVRDLALGVGTVAATRGSSDDAGRWIRFGLLSDALDVIIGAGSARLLGGGGAASAALIPAPFVAADLWIIRNL